MFLKSLIALLITSPAFATQILIKESGASPVEFTQYLKDHPEAISYSTYLTNKEQENPRQEEELFSLGEHMDGPSKELTDRLIQIEKSQKLSPTSLHYIFDLSAKLLQKAKTPELKILNCKVRGLLSVPHEHCAKTAVSFESIERQWPSAENLMIESAAYPVKDRAFLEVSNEAAYHWTLTSNTHKPVQFYGTYAQFMQQTFSMEAMTQGSCSDFTTNTDEFILNTEGAIFFNNGCIKKLTKPIATTSFSEWVRENKTWLYPVGALIIGGVAYSLKDKTLVIEKP